MTTAFFTDERFANHNMPGHPEHAGRLKAIMELYQKKGIPEQVTSLKNVLPATDEQLLAVHSQRHLDNIALTEGQMGLLGPDTYVSPLSYQLARLATGATIAVVESVVKGAADNGIAAVRPPGHHATKNNAMGFCLFNNIAVAAREMCQKHSLERVAIVDFDVHHGNGTEDIFYDDPKVLYISSHQSPLYPGTGRATDTGKDAGKGFTLNAPLPPGTGDTGAKQVYEAVIWPAIRRFKPRLILVSAGYDAHYVDPLANLQFSHSGFDYLARQLITLAKELCGGKIVFVTEGGYDLQALSHAWLNVAYALLGKDELSDPYGDAPSERPLPADLISQLKTIHQLD